MAKDQQELIQELAQSADALLGGDGTGPVIMTIDEEAENQFHLPENRVELDMTARPVEHHNYLLGMTDEGIDEATEALPETYRTDVRVYWKKETAQYYLDHPERR